MKIALSTESSADLIPELVEKYKAHIISYTVTLGETEHKDGVDLTGKELIDFTIKTGKLGRTSAINVNEYTQYFQSIFDEGYDEVIHIALSSGITSSCQNAFLAAEEFGGKVKIIDSLSLSTGLSLLAIYAGKLIEAGKSADEVVKLVKERVPGNQTSFCFESVEFLYKGGRCSAMARFGANLLKLRPQIIMHSDTGKMDSGKKFRGPVKKWVMDYVEETLKSYPNFDKEAVFITHTIYGEEDRQVLDMVRARLKEAGFRNIYEALAGATISCHCGPNTLGILYMNDGEHPVA